MNDPAPESLPLKVTAWALVIAFFALTAWIFAERALAVINWFL